jgi:hypothetical protein
MLTCGPVTCKDTLLGEGRSAVRARGHSMRDVRHDSPMAIHDDGDDNDHDADNEDDDSVDTCRGHDFEDDGDDDDDDRHDPGRGRGPPAPGPGPGAAMHLSPSLGGEASPPLGGESTPGKSMLGGESTPPRAWSPTDEEGTLARPPIPVPSPSIQRPESDAELWTDLMRHAGPVLSQPNTPTPTPTPEYPQQPRPELDEPAPPNTEPSPGSPLQWQPTPEGPQCLPRPPPPPAPPPTTPPRHLSPPRPVAPATPVTVRSQRSKRSYAHSQSSTLRQGSVRQAQPQLSHYTDHVFWYGCFRITFHAGGQTGLGLYRATCPFHRLNVMTRCSRSVSVLNSGETARMYALRLLFTWCLGAPEFNRRRDHKTFDVRLLVDPSPLEVFVYKLHLWQSGASASFLAKSVAFLPTKYQRFVKPVCEFCGLAAQYDDCMHECVAIQNQKQVHRIASEQEANNSNGRCARETYS